MSFRDETAPRLAYAISIPEIWQVMKGLAGDALPVATRIT